MRRIIILISFILLNASSFAQSGVNIVPRPEILEIKPGQFLLNKKVSIHYTSGQSNLKWLADYTQHQLKERFDIKISEKGKSSQSILLSIEKDINGLGDEGYILVISPRQVKITAMSAKGIFYGIQSFLQAIPFTEAAQTPGIPCLYIKDKPQFSWRGMMLDVSRHFYTVKEIKEFLDIMAAYKMNVFHWHLCDDQGWRLEIKKYPKLTRVGAWRMEVPGAVFYPNDSSLKEKPERYGGFYTQKEVGEIVAYAKDRNIMVIPEIEMPGHSEAALAAYPEFSCRQKPQVVAGAEGFPPGATSNYDPSNDSTFSFLENILTEVRNIFPSKYIHIGGDEVDKTDWKNSPACQALIKTKGLKNEEGLQSYFIHRIAAFLASHGRTIIGWDETLEGGLAPNAVVMSWRGIKGGILAAQMHHNVVMSPGNPLYFNRYQGNIQTEPLAATHSVNSLEKVYSLDPVPVQLDTAEAKYIMGAEGAVWTEFISTQSYLQYMLLPRILALSEDVWSGSQNKNWNDFLQRLQYQFQLFNKEKWNYDHKDLIYNGN